MPFDLKNLNPAVKFYYPGTRKAEWLELRNIPIGELRKMRKRCVKQTVEYYRPDDSKGQPYRYETEDIDDDKFNEMLWDYQIVSWKIIDPEGKEIPCTLENKLLLMGNSTEFADWVVKCLNKLAKDSEKKKEDSEKN